MAISKKIIKFLEKNKVKYDLIKHRKVFTAFDKAATIKIKLNLIGKTLILKGDNKLIMVLISGNKNLDKNKFKKIAKIKKIDFVSEKLIKNKFKGVKIGTIPPFGILWKTSTFIDKKLFQNSKIFINAGDYCWSIKINPNNLKKIIPDLIVGNFSQNKK